MPITRNINPNMRSSSQRIQDSENLMLWRYIPLDRFLLSFFTNKFYFPLIKELNDSLEGDLNKANKLLDGNRFSDTEIQNCSDCFRVLSFYNAEIECDLMWRAYCKEGGVALVTTLDKIIENFELSDEAVALRVHYGEEKQNVLHPIAYKSGAYHSEKEVRIVQGQCGINVRESLKNQSRWSEDDKYIKFERWDFLDEIFISPDNSNYVKSIIETAFDSIDSALKKKIRDSTIIRRILNYT